MSVTKGGGIVNWKGYNLQQKLMRTYSILFLVLMLMAFSGIYFGVRIIVQDNIEGSLENSSYLINSMIQTAIDTSIKNHLRTTAEIQYKIATDNYKRFEEGLMNEDEAKKSAYDIMRTIEIGSTGYIYILDSKGVLVEHPFDEMKGRNISEWDFVQTQIEIKKGYIEYDWKNPNDSDLRPKALYMLYFEPWDWIISVSSYREEFLELIDVDDFEDRVLNVQFGEDGYSIVLDYEGTFLIHPKQKGRNVIREDDSQASIIQKVIEQKEGIIEYPWRNPGEDEPRQKITVLSNIPEYQWIIASTAYKEDFYGPVNDLAILLGVFFLFSLIIMLFVTTKVSKRITKPIRLLKEKVLAGADGDLTVRIDVNDDRDEISELGSHFNTFIESLETQQQQLKELNEGLEKLVDERTLELQSAQGKIHHIEKVQSMNELIKTMAHHMGTPLGNAIMSTSFLNNQINDLYQYVEDTPDKVIDSTKSKIDAAYKMAMRNLNRSASLIDMFKLLARRSDDFEVTRVDIDEMIHKIVSDIAVNVRNISIDCEKGLGINSYNEIIELIIRNILNNSIEHSSEDHKLVEIHISAKLLEEFLEITIADKGKGIAEDDIDRVFDPFFSKGRSTDLKGLGLSIVHNAIYYLLDGEIELESKPGLGTWVRVKIPCETKSAGNSCLDE